MKIIDQPYSKTLTQLKDLPLSIRAYKQGDKESQADSGGNCIYVRKKYPGEGLLCSIRPLSGYSYKIKGDPVNLCFIASLLNSETGAFLFERGSSVSKINSRTISSFPIPEASELESSSVGLLEAYVMTIEKLLDVNKGDNDFSNNIKVTFDFLSKVRNYYVMELYEPEEFEKRDISIIKGWEEIVEYLDIRPHETSSLEKTLELFKLILRKGQSLLTAFNQMKVYQGELRETLRAKINEGIKCGAFC